jgi:hypothetical protein
LDLFFKTFNHNLLELTNNLSNEIIYSNRLILVSKYNEFFKILNKSITPNRTVKALKSSSQVKEAASLLIELLEAECLVPFKFKRRLIFECGQFFDGFNVFNEKQLISLLRIMTDYENVVEFNKKCSHNKENKENKENEMITDLDDEQENESKWNRIRLDIQTQLVQTLYN